VRRNHRMARAALAKNPAASPRGASSSGLKQMQGR
jgi:hypothetical protein